MSGAKWFAVLGSAALAGSLLGYYIARGGLSLAGLAADSSIFTAPSATVLAILGSAALGGVLLGYGINRGTRALRKDLKG